MTQFYDKNTHMHCTCVGLYEQNFKNYAFLRRITYEAQRRPQLTTRKHSSKKIIIT